MARCQSDCVVLALPYLAGGTPPGPPIASVAASMQDIAFALSAWILAPSVLALARHVEYNYDGKCVVGILFFFV